MPKIVNKEEKRIEIAMACVDLLHEVGIKKLTVAAAAKAAGIGKGTIYEYFESKEDIIFKIIGVHIAEHNEETLKKIALSNNIKEKITCLFEFVLDESEENDINFNGFKEYLSVMLADTTESYKSFNCVCDDFFSLALKDVFEDAISKGELKENSLYFINSIAIFKKGLALSRMSVNDFSARDAYEEFIDNFFDLLGKKND